MTAPLNAKQPDSFDLVRLGSGVRRKKPVHQSSEQVFKGVCVFAGGNSARRAGEGVLRMIRTCGAFRRPERRGDAAAGGVPQVKKPRCGSAAAGRPVPPSGTCTEPLVAGAKLD